MYAAILTAKQIHLLNLWTLRIKIRRIKGPSYFSRSVPSKKEEYKQENKFFQFIDCRKFLIRQMTVKRVLFKLPPSLLCSKYKSQLSCPALGSPDEERTGGFFE